MSAIRNVPAVPPRSAGPIGEASSTHFVQFYNDDTYLVDTLGRFIGTALGAGDSAVVIATEPHRVQLSKALEARGLDVSVAASQGRYVALDAAETLAAFMRDGWPDGARFSQLIGRVLEAAQRASDPVSGRVSAFGEMVALLWAEGKCEAAIRLEELWNDLAKSHSFSLCCAYPMNGFHRQAHSEPFLRICDAHSPVIPVDVEAPADSADGSPRTIARLQQKALALETEIREHAAIQNALRQREAELTDFMENAAIALHRVAADGTIVWANRAEMELLGYGPQEYIGHHIAEFHADRAAVEDILNRLARNERIHAYEARLRCKDGSLRHVLIDSSALIHEGKFVHTRCSTLDITERKRAEEELRLNQERLRLIQTAAGIGTWELDVGDETLEISPDAAAILGFSRSVGMISFEDLLKLLYFSADRDRVRATLSKAARVNREFATEFRIRRADDSVRMLSMRGKVFHNAGAPVVLGVLIDITPRLDGATRAANRPRSGRRRS